MATSARSISGRDEAVRILLRVEQEASYASLLLGKLPERMEPRERGLARELVLGTLRWQGWLDHALAQFSRRALTRLDPAVRIALRIAAYQILRMDRVPDSAAVDQSVRVARRWVGRSAAGYVNGVLRALCRQAPRFPGDEANPVDRLAVETSHPAWLVARRLARLGPDEGRLALLADNEPARLTVRVNPRMGSREQLRERLERSGSPARPGRWSAGALRLERGAPASELYRSGWLYVQDEASQLVSDLVGPPPGEAVLDLCAAPGGKATDLAGRAGTGPVIAADRHAGRIGLVRDHARRLGAGPMEFLVQDASRPALRPGSFSRILVDAPCSGTGTLRRHPEIRWRLGEKNLTSLAADQDAILHAAAGLLAPGGRLVYSVCSLEPEEGPDRVVALLRERPGLRLLDPRSLAAPVPAELVDESGPGPHLQTWPHRHDLDGFFAAVLFRES